MQQDLERTRSLQTIADAERLIREVEDTLERGRRVMAARRLDFEAARDRLESLPAAERERIRQKVEDELREISERARQEHSHYAQARARAPGRAVRRPSLLV